MKTDIFVDGSRRGMSSYVIRPIPPKGKTLPRRSACARLMALRPRIHRMARRQLGKSFVSLKPVGDHFLDLTVKAGTSTNKRFELRELLGWVALFDNE
ncbi:hypothetical protein A2943_03360 [Candidatus Adlerbacteria bacterium RIFCSPLOWO2_01_FULL_51_16]|uniref:Uncharacterized protein n=1 Tax=Candidatus Adlerbacteria bacterium RIFCSPLOWO2_01_FULL_51_16 TaxID=1797243 RepID=A0A1F4XH67_9BACT|nr:MAG: hypothetical protein A2943_03360 [Candidatus Adlerbacteria bacterium RIFCSPLOWO2_01_FULL_51_16]